MTVEQMMSEKEERQRFETLWWAGALIWAGLVFAADSLGWLPQIGKADAWSWVFLGAGLYALVGDLYRLVSVSHLNPTTWDWVFTGFLLIVGLSWVVGVDMFWPLVLILVGVAFLISVVRRN